MEITVRYFTLLREITGKREEKIDINEGSSLENLLNLLVEKYGKKFEDYITSGKVRKGLQLLFLINGQNVNNLNGLKTLLKSGDVVALIPPVAGG